MIAGQQETTYYIGKSRASMSVTESETPDTEFCYQLQRIKEFAAVGTPVVLTLEQERCQMGNGCKKNTKKKEIKSAACDWSVDGPAPESH